MIDLSRTVRFCLNGPPGSGTPEAATGRAASGRNNTFSAWPAMRGLGRYYELRVSCRGEADAVTGYFMNIKQIDQAVREHVLPYFESCVASESASANIAMGALMRDVMERLQTPLNHSVQQVRLDLTPFFNVTLRSDDMAAVITRQQFEFSAAHRLHVDQFSDEQNREVFGKCNNPSGHGHNYRLEVAMRSPIDEAGQVITAAAIDELVDRVVIEHLDHKHLNIDVPQFADLNPSVENIARVIYDMLEQEVGQLGVALVEVSVWETGKTVCTYAGDAAVVE